MAGGFRGPGLQELRFKKLGFLRTEFLYAARIAFDPESSVEARPSRLAGTPPPPLVTDPGRLLDVVESGSAGDRGGLPAASLDPDVVLVLAVERAGSFPGGRAGDGEAERELLLKELTDPGPVVMEERSVSSAARSDEGRVIGNALR